MSNLQINRDDILSEIFAYPLLKSNEQAVRKASAAILAKNPQLKDTLLVDSNTFLGIEVEVEGVGEIPKGVLAPFWTVKEDGSLRNGGVEFVSTPIRGEGIIAGLHSLQHLLETIYKDHDFSDRTSVHVHVNVRDMTAEALMNYLMLYLVFESSLYKTVFDLVQKKRDDNIFCVPITESGNILGLRGALRAFENGKNADALVGISHSWRKYAGINLIPIRSFGTVEFRHLGGTGKLTKIMSWINLLLALKEFSQGRMYEKLREKILSLNTNSQYELFTKEVFGKMSHHILRYDVRTELENGVVFVKHLLTSPSTDMQGYFGEFKNSFEDSSFKEYVEKELKIKLKERPKVDIVKKDLARMPKKDLEQEYISVGARIVTIQGELSMSRTNQAGTPSEIDQMLSVEQENLRQYQSEIATAYRRAQL